MNGTSWRHCMHTGVTIGFGVMVFLQVTTATPPLLHGLGSFHMAAASWPGTFGYLRMPTANTICINLTRLAAWLVCLRYAPRVWNTSGRYTCPSTNQP